MPRTEEREAFEKLEKLIEQLTWDGFFSLAERNDALEAADGMPLMVAVDLAKIFYRGMSLHGGLLEEVIELAKSGGHHDEK